MILFASVKSMTTLVSKALLLVSLCILVSACLTDVFGNNSTASAADDLPNPNVFLPFVAITEEAAAERNEETVLPEPVVQGNFEEEMLVEEAINQGFGEAQASIAASSSTYYVDCAAGNDNNSGTSTGAAWRTIGKANSATLVPGDRLRFKRGCSWTGPLDASWHGSAAQPIFIGSYGSGTLPKIQNGYSSNVRISGSYQVLENLHATMSSPPNPDPNCNNQPVAWKAGFSFQDGASYNIVQNSEATKLAIGIFFNVDTNHNKALHNKLTNNNVVWELTPSRTLGAMGILLQGDHQEVGYNLLADNRSICTYTGIVESNSIELYAATNASIHHNTSYRDRVFSEMGSSPTVRSENNTYAYNLYVASFSDARYGARFVVTRGWNHPFGPVLGTKVLNNTVYLTGSGSKGVVCEQCENSVLTMENNVLWVNREPFSSDGPFVERNNLFWSGGPSLLLNLYGLILSNGTVVADPQFVDVAANNFALRTSSPGINRGTWISLNAGFDFDLSQSFVPIADAPDIGAFERRYAPWEKVFTIPGRIEAEDYRSGGQGIGYSDTTVENSGRAYRDDGVDILETQDVSGNYAVGYMEPGEWLAYEIYASVSATYRVVVRVATPSGDRRFHLEIDGVPVTGSVTIPWTGSWQSWVDVPVNIPIRAGRHSLRLVAETDRFDINYLAVSKYQ